ncbi:hypothetical protein ACF0H5_022714 [Mactra antiquata]
MILMTVVKDLNKRLHYQNIHQNCILDEKTEEIKKLNQELLHTNIKVKIDPENVRKREEELSGEITHWKIQVNQLEEENQTLCQDRDALKQKYWDGLKRLDEAHRLLNVHLHNASQYRDEHLAEVDKNKQLQELLDATNSDLNKNIDEMKQIKMKYDNDMIAWNDEKVKLTADNDSLSKELETLKELHKASEVTLEEFTENVQDLEKKLSEALSKLNVEKISKDTQTDLTMLSMVDNGIQITPATDTKELQTNVVMETKLTQTIDPAYSSKESQTEDECKVKVLSCDVSSQIDVQTTHQACQTEHLAQTFLQNTGTQTLTIVKIDTNETEAIDATIVDNGSSETKVNEEMPRRRSTGYVPDVSSVQTNVSMVTMEEDQGKNSKSEDNIKDNNQYNGTHCDNMNVKPAKEDETSCKEKKIFNDELDTKGTNLGMGQKKLIMDKRNNGVVFNQPNEYAGPRHGEVNTEGIAVPVLDMNKIHWGVAVDPNEFNTSIELSQDVTTSEVNKNVNGSSGAMDMSDKHKKMNSRDHSNKADLKSSEAVNGASDGHTENKWVVSDGQMKAVKAKSRKHKLATENIDNHFYNFNQTKSMFEATTHGDDDNDFQSKLPKLNKTHRSTNSGVSLKSKQLCAMFEMPSSSGKKESSNKETSMKNSNKIDSSILEERQTKHPHTLHSLYGKTSLSYNGRSEHTGQIDTMIDYPSDGIKVPNLYDGNCIVSTMEGNSASKSYKTFTSDTLTSRLSSKASTTTTTAGFKSGSLFQQSNISVSLSEVGSSTTSSSEKGSSITSLSEIGTSISDMTKCSDSVNESNREPGDVDMDPKTSNKNMVPKKYASISHNMSNHSVQDATNPVDDNSSTKQISNKDVLQKYKHIVAKLKTTRTNTVPQVSSESTGKSLLPSNNQDVVTKKGDNSNQTNNESCATHVGILKDTKRGKKQTKNVSWFEYVSHKEYIPSSPEDQETWNDNV